MLRFVINSNSLCIPKKKGVKWETGIEEHFQNHQVLTSSSKGSCNAEQPDKVDHVNSLIYVVTARQKSMSTIEELISSPLI